MSKLTSRTPEEERGVPMTHAQCAFGGAPELTFPFTLLHLKGELQRQNKLLSAKMPFGVLQNETKIV